MIQKNECSRRTEAALRLQIRELEGVQGDGNLYLLSVKIESGGAFYFIHELETFGQDL